jgi:hypothetical protein
MGGNGTSRSKAAKGVFGGLAQRRIGRRIKIMTYIRSTFRHPALPKNDLGYTVDYYEGSLSTLCAGCGHDSINAAIVQACWEMNIEPHKVAKLSGIGCSSKSPAYFLSNSHGFNSVHGRMPSVATGANLANRDMIYLGVSGDGDTASIGMGQFVLDGKPLAFPPSLQLSFDFRAAMANGTIARIEHSSDCDAKFLETELLKLGIQSTPA